MLRASRATDTSQLNIEFDYPKHYAQVSYGSFKVKEIGSYSIIDDETFQFQEKAVYPTLNNDIGTGLDLNSDYENYRPRDSTKDGERHERLLRWIVEKKYSLDGIKVVVSRGILKDIGTLIYNFYRNPIELRVTKYEGVWYFGEFAGKEVMGEEQRRNSHYGQRFEKMITTLPKDDDEDSKKQTYSVVEIDMGDLMVLSRGEIDAVNPATNNKVEIKSLKIPRRPIQLIQNKYPGIWLQSTLGNTDEVLIGMRSGGGIITQIKKYTLFKMEKECKQYWDGGAIKGFIKSVLDWILPLVDEGQTGTVNFAGGKYCGSMKMSVKDGNFLPEWYKKYIDTISN